MGSNVEETGLFDEHAERDIKAMIGSKNLALDISMILLPIRRRILKKLLKYFNYLKEQQNTALYAHFSFALLM